ncbi:MAG TPA: acetyl-CoA carboxylase biotin carboxyl carrier protein [Mariprofundaceae bacterium]|nr:acetyl-CoA carboxylase biotin carboxyl carrier protein [Mariprofundaceae bacterium]
MDIPQIRKLMRLIENSDVTEIEVTEGEQTVRISRQSAAPVMAAPAAAPQQVQQAPAPETAAPASNDEKENTVKSPMVGTFYRASSPEAEPYVSQGSKVKKGETLCIIEAMKLMNEIEAEYDGVVQDVLVENASPVEYGQPMFVIKPL